MEMSKYILRILRSNLIVIWSWGFNNPVALPNGLRFNVQGFLYTGNVEVIYNDGVDLFEVRTFNADGSVKEVVDNVYLDCLVNVIDSMVEKTNDYKQRVNLEYNLM